MAASSVQRRLVALLAVAVAATALQGMQPSPAAAAPPPTYQAPARPTFALSPPPPTVMGQPSTSPGALAMANASGQRTQAPLAAQSMVEPGPALLAANELPVRFVPNTTITTPVKVTNTYSTTLPATYQVSYRWTEVGSTTDMPRERRAVARTILKVAMTTTSREPPRTSTTQWGQTQAQELARPEPGARSFAASSLGLATPTPAERGSSSSSVEQVMMPLPTVGVYWTPTRSESWVTLRVHGATSTTT